MSKLSKLFTPILVLSGLLLLMFLTNPYELHFIFLLVPFIMVGVLTFLVIRLLAIHLLHFSKTHALSTASIAAATTVILLSLSSLRQLTVLDFVLTLAFAMLTGWYIKRYFFPV